MFKPLQFCPLFRGLDIDTISSLLGSVQYQVLNFIAGQQIAQNQDVCDRMLIVLDGSVKCEMTDGSGKTIKIEDLGPGQPLAAAFLFGMQNKFPVDVSANVNVQMLSIQKPQLLKLMQLSELVLNNYLNVICTRSQFLANKIKFLTFRTIKEKIALYLLEQSQNGTYHTITINFSQQEMADLFGVTRPSLARTLGEMETEKLISITKKEFTILNIAGLKGMLVK